MPQDTTGNYVAVQEQPSDVSDAIFARRLRELRQLAGVTQKELAEQMTVVGHRMHQSAIAKIESGDRPVTIGEAVQLAGFLGVDLAELVTDPGPDTEERRARLARVEAQVHLRSLQHEAAHRHELMEEARLLYEHTLERIEWAKQRVAELGGELPPAASGKDDQ